jgi:hypothetical protein
MAVDVTKLPPVLPLDVRRVEDDGRATQWTTDWDAYQRNWFATTAVDLQTQVNTVSASFGTLSGEVTDIRGVVQNGDGSLTAGKLTTVKALSDSATASGAVYLAATAGPTGSSAAYGWFITAGSVSVGMKAVVDSVTGLGSISFSANSFSLEDSGTATNVFTYSGGIFTFNVPVSIRTGDIAASAVSNMAVVTGTLASTNSLSVSMTTLAAKKVVILMSVNAPSGASGAYLSVNHGLTQSTNTVSVDGTAVGSFYAQDVAVASSTVTISGNSVVNNLTWFPENSSHQVLLAGTLSAGSHTFTLSTNNPLNMAGGMTIIEFRDH